METWFQHGIPLRESAISQMPFIITFIAHRPTLLLISWGRLAACVLWLKSLVRLKEEFMVATKNARRHKKARTAKPRIDIFFVPFRVSGGKFKTSFLFTVRTEAKEEFGTQSTRRRRGSSSILISLRLRVLCVATNLSECRGTVSISGV